MFNFSNIDVFNIFVFFVVVVYFRVSIVWGRGKEVFLFCEEFGECVLFFVRFMAIFFVFCYGYEVRGVIFYLEVGK